MEATGRDGGWGPSWSYRRRHEGTESSSYTVSSSSRSGTIVSSTAHISGASRLSSGLSMEAAALLELDSELSLGTPDKMDSEVSSEFAQPIKKPRNETEEILKKMRMKRIESLVQEFFHGPSENRSILSGGGGGMSALEKWFLELGVSWVLQLNVGGASERHPLPGERMSWVRALTQIMETIHGFVGKPAIAIGEEEVESGERATSLDPVQFALFFQEAIRKMLVFVDVVFSKSLAMRGPADTASKGLISYLDIYGALSRALSGIRLQFHSPPSAEVGTIEKEMVSLLSAKQGKATVAIWSTLEEIRTHALKPLEKYSSSTQTLQGSSNIHGATTLLTNHIDILLCNESTVAPLVSQAASLGKYVPQTGLGEAQPFISLITEMVSCLEEKLITKSQLFLDKGLGLLFLLNNLNYIWDTVNKYIDTKDKLGHYIESYIQVSWAPMLSCLFSPTPTLLCLGRNYSPLSTFESEFQKIYTTQKLWKVLDPRLRKRLRKAIIDKIIPGYTEYIEDNKVTNPKFTPQELEEMLQELFEG